jgi:cytochrome c oxidase cbb3-type subunit IV
MSMDINVVRGLFTLLLMVIFIGIVFWAYSSRRKKDFDEAAQLPLQDDEPLQRRQAEQDKGKRDE